MTIYKTQKYHSNVFVGIFRDYLAYVCVCACFILYKHFCFYLREPHKSRLLRLLSLIWYSTCERAKPWISAHHALVLSAAENNLLVSNCNLYLFSIFCFAYSKVMMSFRECLLQLRCSFEQHFKLPWYKFIFSLLQDGV